METEAQKMKKAQTDQSVFCEALRDHLAGLNKQLHLSHVTAGMGVEEHFVYLQGFCPKGNVSQIKKTADEDGWAYLIQDPEDTFEVPTLIRYPKWLRMIDPLFKFMGTIPGYNEYDISFWFLLFFCMCRISMWPQS